MRPFTAWILLLGLATLAGCRSDARVQPPRLGEVLPDLPLPPEASFVSRSGSADALQLTFHSEADEEDVLRYYRAVLSDEPWDLVSDVKDRDGRTVLYAERNGPPLWVRIGRAAGTSGTAVELSGAIPDTTRRASPR